MDNNILIKYKDIEQLNLRRNRLVTDLNFLTKLKKLNITGHEIRDQGIKGLNLEILIANGSCITKLNHMTNLRKLDISFCYQFDKNGINNLNLETLSAYHTPNITDVNSMTKLKRLSVGEFCGIDDHGIKHVNLESLYMIGNTKIINIDHMTNLKKLSVGKLVAQCMGYESLDISNVFNDGLVSDLRNMRELKKLRVHGNGVHRYILDNSWKEIDSDEEFDDPTSDSEFDYI